MNRVQPHAPAFSSRLTGLPRKATCTMTSLGHSLTPHPMQPLRPIQLDNAKSSAVQALIRTQAPKILLPEPQSTSLPIHSFTAPRPVVQPSTYGAPQLTLWTQANTAILRSDHGDAVIVRDNADRGTLDIIQRHTFLQGISRTEVPPVEQTIFTWCHAVDEHGVASLRSASMVFFGDDKNAHDFLLSGTDRLQRTLLNRTQPTFEILQARFATLPWAHTFNGFASSHDPKRGALKSIAPGVLARYDASFRETLGYTTASIEFLNLPRSTQWQNHHLGGLFSRYHTLGTRPAEEVEFAFSRYL